MLIGSGYFSDPFQARLAGLVACGSSAPSRLGLSEPFQARLAGLVACGSSAPSRLGLSEPFHARLAGLVACGSSAPSRLALLLLSLSGLVVVGADDVVGEVGVRRGVEHRRALALENEGVTLLLAHLLDQPADVLENLGQHGFLLLLQRVLQVVHEPPGIAHLPLQKLLLLASRVVRQELSLL